MAKPKPAKRRPKRKVKTKKGSVVCEQCGLQFSKAANLKVHVEKVHKGLRWKCPICSKLQVSKHSHERHYEKNHSRGAPLNADANMRYPNVFDRMPEKTKDEQIKSLTEENRYLETLVKNFRERLLQKMKENWYSGWNVERE